MDCAPCTILAVFFAHEVKPTNWPNSSDKVTAWWSLSLRLPTGLYRSQKLVLGVMYVASGTVNVKARWSSILFECHSSILPIGWNTNAYAITPRYNRAVKSTDHRVYCTAWQLCFKSSRIPHWKHSHHTPPRDRHSLTSGNVLAAPINHRCGCYRKAGETKF
jgi:hypothetical protein